MKALVPAVVLVGLLAACGDAGSTTTVPPGTQAPSTSQPTPTTRPPAPTTVPAPTSTTAPPATTTTTTAPLPDNSGAEGSGCTPGQGPLPDGRWYGLVAGVDDMELSFDLACWFSGEAAARAAAEDGEESPPPNDYYVRNANPALRQLTATSEALVRWYRSPGDPATETTTTYGDWVRGRASRSFQPGVWVVVDDGVVTEIAEQYTP